MIKDDRNFHQRLQEFCDCYMETDPKKELEKAAKGVSGDPSGDLDELALKFLGLGIFYGASEKAKRISIERAKEGKVLFSVESRGKYQLPPPRYRLQIESSPLLEPSPILTKLKERNPYP